MPVLTAETIGFHVICKSFNTYTSDHLQQRDHDLYINKSFLWMKGRTEARLRAESLLVCAFCTFRCHILTKIRL